MGLEQIQQYVLPVERDDWSNLLAPWAELIPPNASRWLLSRFGELFFEQEDGPIGMLQVSGFQYLLVAENKQDFEERLADPDKIAEWFLSPLVDRLVMAGKVLADRYCYSFIIPLALGGRLTDENAMAIPIEEHFGCFGDIFRQIRDLPDGAEIRLKLTD